MKKQRRQIVPTILLTATVLVTTLGCASSAKVARFSEFSAVGQKYITAMQALLDESGRVMVEANSKKLLHNQQLAALTIEAFSSQDDAMKENLEELRLLDLQMRLMSRYFSQLSELAASDAPEVIARECAATAASIHEVGVALERGLPTGAGVKDQVVASIGTVIVRGAQARSLRRELQARADLISRSLHVHQMLLQVVRHQIASDLAFEAQRRYDEEVVAPLLGQEVGSESGQWEEWAAKRWELLKQRPLVEELDKAEAAAVDLRVAWASLLAGKFEPVELASMAGDLETILIAVADGRGTSG